MLTLGLRARLTLLHSGLFLGASAVITTLMYLRSRSGIIRFGEAIPTVPTVPAVGAIPRDRASAVGQVPTVPGVKVDQAKETALNGLLVQSVLAFLILCLVAAILGWWLTGRVLRRVRRMTAQARRISTLNLHERLSIDGPGDEIKELADTFDALLDRLDASFHSQARFIANASHELRTPLALNRTAVQVGLSSSDPERIQQVREQLLRTNDRCVALINGLLELARSESGPHRRELVRMDLVVEETLAETDAHGLEIHCEAAPCAVLGDPLLLGQVVRNLLDNALRYNAPGGRVWVRLESTADDAVLGVSNTGPDVPAHQVDRLFEPFHRGAVRPAGAKGAGLGLSIVRAVVTAHDGVVRAEPRRGGGLETLVRLPRAHRGVRKPPTGRR